MPTLNINNPRDARQYARNMIVDINVNDARYKQSVVNRIQKLKALTPKDKETLIKKAKSIKHLSSQQKARLSERIVRR